jgi:predicted secreted protein
MPRSLGRKAVLKMGTPAAVVAAVQSKSLQINNTLVDVTADNDNGVRTYIEEAAMVAVTIPVSGVVDDNKLLELSMNAVPFDDFVLDYGTFTVSGRFGLENYSEDLATGGARTFSGTLQSSGAVIKANTP